MPERRSWFSRFFGGGASQPTKAAEAGESHPMVEQKHSVDAGLVHTLEEAGYRLTDVENVLRQTGFATTDSRLFEYARQFSLNEGKAVKSVGLTADADPQRLQAWLSEITEKMVTLLVTIDSSLEERDTGKGTKLQITSEFTDRTVGGNIYNCGSVLRKYVEKPNVAMVILLNNPNFNSDLTELLRPLAPTPKSGKK